MPALVVGAAALISAAPCVAAERPSGEWVVEDIGGRGIIGSSHVTLNLDEPGRISGSGGCNRYTAEVADDEGMAIAPAAATRRMCPEALMLQERRFVEVLAAVGRHEVDATGALRLIRGEDGAVLIVARRN